MKKFITGLLIGLYLLLAFLTLFSFAGETQMRQWANEGQCGIDIMTIHDNVTTCKSTGNCAVLITCKVYESTSGIDLSDWTASTVIGNFCNSITAGHPRMGDILNTLYSCDTQIEGVKAGWQSLP
jgi:hypothetical protein